MGWFSSLFSSKSSKIKEIQTKTLKTEIAHPAITEGNKFSITQNVGWSGFRFIATLQLRTPLKILLCHNKTFHQSERHHYQQLITASWQAIISVETSDFGTKRKIASEIGYIDQDGGTLLPFLVAVRKYYEQDSQYSDNPYADLIELCKAYSDPKVVKKLGGANKIAEYFFPKTLCFVNGINTVQVNELWKKRIRCITDVIKATDEKLLSIPQIGQKTIVALRKFSENDSIPKNACYLDKDFKIGNQK